MTKETEKAAGAAKPKGIRSRQAAKRGSRNVQYVNAALATSAPPAQAGFLAKTRLKKAGGSLVMTVPASARNLLQLVEGQEMSVSVEGTRVIFEPIPADAPARVRSPKYTLDELVTGMDPDAPLTAEERAWMDAPPMGREIW